MKYFFLSLAYVFALTGCFEQPAPPKVLTQEELNAKAINEVAVLKSVKESYLQGLEKASIYDLYLPASYYVDYPDLSVTFPFVYGSKIDMDKEHYTIRRYSGRAVLFPNYGIKDRFNISYGNDANYEQLRKMGFASFQDLYLFVFNKLTSYPLRESYEFITSLEKERIVDSDIVLNMNAVEIRNESYIKKAFSNYFEFEKNVFQNSDVEEALENWYLDANGKLITLNKDDFKIYSLTDFIVKKVLASKKAIFLKKI